MSQTFGQKQVRESARLGVMQMQVGAVGRAQPHYGLPATPGHPRRQAFTGTPPLVLSRKVFE